MRIALALMVLVGGCAHARPRDGRYLAWSNYCRASWSAEDCDRLWDKSSIDPF